MFVCTEKVNLFYAIANSVWIFQPPMMVTSNLKHTIQKKNYISAHNQFGISNYCTNKKLQINLKTNLSLKKIWLFNLKSYRD